MEFTIVFLAIFSLVGY